MIVRNVNNAIFIDLENFLLLNFDGSVVGNLGFAGIGSVISDSVAEIVLSYSGPAGRCLVNEADILAMRTGLWEANCCHLRNLVVEGDSLL